MTNHAILSASASHRWLNCPPSARLTEDLPDTTSDFAIEGSDAHELCAYLVEKALGRNARDPNEDLTFYNDEMQECAEEYRNYVMEQVEKARGYSRDPTVLIEQRLDFSEWVPEGFGTGDCIIVADGRLQVIDYKHGLGVQVDADHNPQMMCYALGALEMFDGLYNFDNVTMTIFQPRKHNISTFKKRLSCLNGLKRYSLQKLNLHSRVRGRCNLVNTANSVNSRMSVANVLRIIWH